MLWRVQETSVISGKVAVAVRLVRLRRGQEARTGLEDTCGEINGLRSDNFFDLTPPLQFLVKKPNPLFAQRQRLPRSWIVVRTVRR